LETGVVSSGNDKTDQAPTKELSPAQNHERQPETFGTVTKIEIQNLKTMTHARAWAYLDSRNETHGTRRGKPSRTTTKPGEGSTHLLANRDNPVGGNGPSTQLPKEITKKKYSNGPDAAPQKKNDELAWDGLSPTGTGCVRKRNENHEQQRKMNNAD
jgi:hypothetical protein